jgi:hypothetical protein
LTGEKFAKYNDNDYRYHYGVLGVMHMATVKTAFAGWLAVQLAPTLCGSKPATILTLADAKGQPLYSLWDRFGDIVLAGTGLEYQVFFRDCRRHIVLFYRPEVLRRQLEEGETGSFLRRLGYPVGEGLQRCLQVLKERFGNGCPHEIGVFLGIPLKDVMGFMGFSGEPLSCRGEWCVYGDACQSLGAMRRFAADRDRVAACLRQGGCPLAVLAGKDGGDTAKAG